jgi:hypothetical protein
VLAALPWPLQVRPEEFRPERFLEEEKHLAGFFINPESHQVGTSRESHRNDPRSKCINSRS